MNEIDSNRLASFRLSICTICECSFIFRVFVDVTFNGVWATTDSLNICNCFSMEMTLKLVAKKKRKQKADAKRHKTFYFIVRKCFSGWFSTTGFPLRFAWFLSLFRFRDLCCCNEHIINCSIKHSAKHKTKNHVKIIIRSINEVSKT